MAAKRKAEEGKGGGGKAGMEARNVPNQAELMEKAKLEREKKEAERAEAARKKKEEEERRQKKLAEEAAAAEAKLKAQGKAPIL